VDSILAQSYTNLEIILVDDGSPDNCPAICDEYAEKDDRVRVIHKPNGGLSDARNAGLDIATGAYVTFVDSDDWIDIDHISSLKFVLESHSHNAISVSDVSKLNVNNEMIASFKYNNNQSDINQSIFGYVWNKLYSVELFNNYRFSVGCKFAEDLIINSEIFKMSPDYVYTQKATYNYFQRELSITTALISDKKIDDFLTFAKQYEIILSEIYYDEEYYQKYNSVVGNLSCNLMCEITLSKSMKLSEKNRLMNKLIYGIENKKIQCKYADNNLLKLFVLTVRLRCPLIYRSVYSILIMCKKSLFK
jgi:glycosyltransferase involved in cell wall biosynthesis